MTKTKLVDRIGQFTTIPNSVIKLWNSIGHDGMLMFLYLRYRSDEHDECFPSYNTIQRDTGLPRQRIADGLKALESCGLVERKRRFGNSTIYILKLPISRTDGLMEDDTISRPVELLQSDSQTILVGQVDTNQIQLTRLSTNQTQLNNAPAPDTRTGDSLFDDSPAGKQRRRTVEAMQRGQVKQEYLEDEIRKHLRLNVTQNKTWRAVIKFLKEKPEGETVGDFADWWFNKDWRGKQGQSPTPNLIMELWPQAFASNEEIVAERTRNDERSRSKYKEWGDLGR